MFLLKYEHVSISSCARTNLWNHNSLHNVCEQALGGVYFICGVFYCFHSSRQPGKQTNILSGQIKQVFSLRVPALPPPPPPPRPLPQPVTLSWTQLGHPRNCHGYFFSLTKVKFKIYTHNITWHITWLFHLELDLEKMFEFYSFGP